MDPALVTAILGVGGVAAILPKVIDGLIAWKNGRALSEKRQNQSILERLAEADKRAEQEADFRRALEEYAGVLRLLLVQAGMAIQQIPPWPVRKVSSDK